jgi:hypothetical protein
MVIVWGVLVAVAYRVLARYAMGALIAGGAVVSHWFLDLIVHRPDLPLVPGGATKLGLGVWNSLGATLALEAIVFGAGLWLYLRCTIPVDRVGRYGTAALAGFLVLIYLANVFGPPPPSASAIAWAGQAQWLLVIAGYWIDRHRRTRPSVAL